MNYTLKLPRTFWEDHYERCRDHEGERTLVSGTKRHVVVTLDDEALADLKSDADLYATKGQFTFEFASLTNSARATMRALKAQLT